LVSFVPFVSNFRFTSAAALALALATADARAQVSVQPLAAPDLFSIAAGPTDLPADLWQGSSAGLAHAVIPSIGTKPLSPAAASLARRLLSTGANGPEGAGEDEALAAARARALLRLGDVAGASAIADHTPNLEQAAEVSEVAAETALIRGDEDRACSLGEGLANGREGAFWLRLRAYCQMKAGQVAPAQLTLDLSAQQGHSPDFERLMAAGLSNGSPGAPELEDGLGYALSRHVLPASWPSGLSAAPAPVAVAVARDPMAPPAARLEAAARAARLGFPTPDAYAAVSPIPPDVAGADQPGPAGEAALVALANTAPDFTVREGAVMALLKRASGEAEFAALARLADPAIAQLIAAKAPLRQPALIALAAAVAGDPASAAAARDQIHPEATTDAISSLAMVNAAVAAAAGRKDAAVMDALAHAPAADGRACQAMALLGALGVPAGPEARYDLSTCDLGAGHAPAGRLAALDLAGRAGRMGDVALYVLMTATDAGPAGLAVPDRAAAVRALDQAGLKADAQAFAVEGLVALQLRP
jgi:hypothetical protein